MTIGLDIVEIGRVRSIRSLDRFAEYFLTPSELAAYSSAADPVSFIASRFAVKEATIKAFPGFLSPHDFEIIKEGAKPVVRFFSIEKEAAYCAAVSITHSTQFAAGCAVVTKKLPEKMAAQE